MATIGEKQVAEVDKLLTHVSDSYHMRIMILSAYLERNGWQSITAFEQVDTMAWLDIRSKAYPKYQEGNWTLEQKFIRRLEAIRKSLIKHPVQLPLL